jgi:hypothetical protein
VKGVEEFILRRFLEQLSERDGLEEGGEVKGRESESREESQVKSLVVGREDEDADVKSSMRMRKVKGANRRH